MPSQIQVNGSVYDWGSISFNINGERYYNVTSISYGETLEVSKRYGAGRHSTGRTIGQLQMDDCSLTMAKEDVDSLLQTLGNEYMKPEFTITIAYGNEGQATTTDQLISCRIKNISNSHSTGSEALALDLTIDVMRMTRNGLSGLGSDIQQQPVATQGG